MLETFRGATDSALAAITEDMLVRKTSEIFLLFTMGSQTDHLIFQMVAKLGVYCLVADPASVTAEDVRKLNPKGIIVSGGPASVATEPPPFDREIFTLGIPVLGICLGFQMWAKYIGLTVESGRHQYATHLATTMQHALFAGIPRTMRVLQSHGDEIMNDALAAVDGFRVLSSSDDVMAAACYNNGGHNFVGVQFHPELPETEFGAKMLSNFCFRICKAKDRYPVKDVAARKIEQIRQTVGDKKVLIALSGGCDSSICAYLLKAANLGPGKVHAVYIRGIDRPDDEEFVLNYFANQAWITVEIVDATDQFLEAFVGKFGMHDKRMAMRGVYKPILEAKAAQFGSSFICQGTLFTDISESGGGYDSGARKAKIKQHHNTNLDFSLPELLPLADCVKDGARDIGREIGVPELLITRHPFPGPGLAVRNEDEITRAKLAMSRAADGIWISELRKNGLYEKVWQAGAVITKSEHTCTQGDDSGKGLVIALWAVYSVNGFTARPAHIPMELLEHVANRICNEVPGAGAVVYRISSKPITTIEWG